MKKRFIFPVLGLVLLTALVFMTFRWWKVNTSAVSSDETKISFLIPKGKSASEVGTSLYQKGLIKNPFAFKLYVQLFDKSSNINAGEFTLSPSMTLAEIVEKLGKGPEELWVTIPEGMRREEVVEIFIEGLGKKEQEETEFRNTFLSLTQGKEGYLFPDTYLFPREATADLVLTSMSNTFDRKIESISGLIDGSDFTLGEIITMASIIERETNTDTERPIVAGILWKRLETDGWLMQADASVQYAVGTNNCMLGSKPISDCEDWWPILTLEDLKLTSPYNSYLVNALPPTPIASPGLASIKAAADPQESDYWYYIHGTDGKIRFAKDLVEHNANIRNYLGK